MNKHLLPLFLGMALLASSCKKDNVVQNEVNPELANLEVPTTFSWQTTRDVNFSIGISDARFQNQIHVIAIYLTEPTADATPISKGSASLISPFNAKLSIPAGINEVYVVKNAPDGSSTAEKVAVTKDKVSVAMSSVRSNERLSSVNVLNAVMATVAEPACKTSTSSTNVVIPNGTDVICYNSNTNQTINVTAWNGGTLKINAPGQTITIGNYGRSLLNLFISEGTTVKFNNLDIWAGETVQNDGVLLASNMTIGGSFVNNGTLTLTGTTFNLYQSPATMTNNGIISAASASMTISAVSSNSGTMTVANALVNTDATFSNYCNVTVNGNITINTQNLNNYKLIYIKGDTHVNSSGTITMYSSAMYQTQTLSTMSGTVIGRGVLASLFKVVGTVGANALNYDGMLRGTLQYCGVDLDVNQWSKKHYEASVTKSCTITIIKDDCNPLGTVPVVKDADGDGVPDLLDDYPNDKTKAYNTYSSNYKNGGATIAFEDSWPKMGDFDLNDVVLNYKHLVITNKDNIVVRVEGEWNLIATGGDFKNGAGIQFPLLKGSATSFVSSNSLPPEVGQDSLVVILFNNSRDEQATWNTRTTEPASAAKKYTFSFNLTNGPTLVNMGASAYNPFIWNGTGGYGRGHETHLQGKKATKLADVLLFNTMDDKSALNNKTYSTINQLPWAIEIPQASFAYPMEMQDISKTYLKFSSWAASGGTLVKDWYSNTGTGYRDASKIFTGLVPAK